LPSMSIKSAKNGPGVRLFQKLPFESGFGTLTPRNDTSLPKSMSTVCAFAEIASPATIAIAVTKQAMLPRHHFSFMSLSQLCGRTPTKETKALTRRNALNNTTCKNDTASAFQASRVPTGNGAIVNSSPWRTSECRHAKTVLFQPWKSGSRIKAPVFDECSHSECHIYSTYSIDATLTKVGVKQLFYYFADWPQPPRKTVIGYRHLPAGLAAADVTEAAGELRLSDGLANFSQFRNACTLQI